MQLHKSLCIIIGSTLLISGSAWALLYRAKHTRRSGNSDDRISFIAQTGPEKNVLPTSVLAEILDLSYDQATSFSAFSPKKAVKKLLEFPLIQSAEIKLIKPNTVHIDYAVRSPVLTLGEYLNIGVDQNGHLFPIEPYLTPKNLPELILGHPLEPPLFQHQIDMRLITKLMSELSATELKRIDLTDLHAKSAGRRQIVVIAGQHTLRLSPKNYQKEIINYFKLCEKMKNTHDNSDKVIDFRIDGMAFIDSGERK
ncbi:MAG TPA: FtsQ-type POTRA domain-containing protein [Chlamydiales bacterium]|nr:FtsQ-type POTRA domain-containing protein [Chlamydiales bacterium]